MANQYFQQFLRHKIKELTMLQGNIVIGAVGAVSSFSGNGIKAVSRLAQGIYQITLTDNYVSLLELVAEMQSPNTGSAVAAGAFVSGTLYTITALGNTNWHAIGVPAAQTPAVGLPFVATGAGAGSGTATAVGASGVVCVELAPGANLTALVGSGKGCASAIIQCFDKLDALVDPVSGSVLAFELWLRNSSLAT